MKSTRFNSFGDTIVEVLIALAIVSAVLAGAYAVASRSLRTARVAQERGEALKVAEGQIEKLKYLAADYLNSGQPTAKNIFDTTPYCLKQDASGVSKITGLTGLTTNVNNDTFPYISTGDCQSGFYNFAITYTPTSPSPGSNDNFSISVRWDRLGSGRDELIIPYRLHP